MRVLVTGASGFVGSHVARALVAAGHAVRALARPTASRAALTDVPEVEWVPGDVVDASTLAPAMRGCDAVVHAAAQIGFTPATVALQRRVNVEGTRHVLEAARAVGVRRFVHTSSVAAIGRPHEGAVADEQARYDWPPGMPYHETKRDAERLVRRAQGIETVVLNPAVVLGPGEITRRTLLAFRLVKWGLLPLVPPGGTTLCDVRDVAEAHVAALTRGQSGERYILGGPQLTFRELATALAEATGGARPLAALPASLLHGAAVPLAALARVGVALPAPLGNLATMTTHGYFSSVRATEALGYRTRPAAETLRDAARWYESQNLL
jgi:dihydroflavonol-4-reductase